MNSDLPPAGPVRPTASARSQADRLGRELGALAEVFDATPVGAGVWDTQQRLAYANPVLCGLLGRSSRELVGTQLSEHLHPGDVESVAAKLRDIWDGRRNYLECELRGRPVEGRPLQLRAYVAAVYTPDGAPGYLMSQIFSFAGPDPHDERVRRLVNHTPAMLWLIDRDGSPRMGNRACFDFIGVHQPAGSIGQQWTDAVHPNDLSEATPHIDSKLAARQPFDFVARSRRRDGEWRWLHHRAEPIFDVDGELEGYAGASVDVTEAERARRDLLDSQRLLADVADAGPLAVARTDADGRVTYLNDRWSELLGDHETRLAGLGWQELIRPEYVDRIIAAGTESIETGRPFQMQVRTRPSTSETGGTEFWGELRAAPIFADDGRHAGFAATLVDVSDAVSAARRADRLAQVLDASSDLVVLATPAGAVTYANDAAAARLEIRIEPPEWGNSFLWDLLDRSSRDIYYDVVEPAIREVGVWRGDLTFIDRGGQPMPVSALLLAHTDELGRVDSISAVARDIGDLKDVENRLRHLATHDNLTGLPNRTLLYDRLDQALARFHRLGHGVALFYCDLDRFKPVNDEQGHSAGDAVLREIARRIGGVVRATDTAARVGGDEFVVLVEGVDDVGLLRTMATRLIESISRPVALGDITARVGVSIGLVRAADGRDDVDTLMKLADRAMYRAKAAGRGRVEMLDELP
jgi:diguanylate cyclase (GGDEF)-like protein/PAS domain S-box-containing protein